MTVRCKARIGALQDQCGNYTSLASGLCASHDPDIAKKRSQTWQSHREKSEQREREYKEREQHPIAKEIIEFHRDLKMLPNALRDSITVEYAKSRFMVVESK